MHRYGLCLILLLLAACNEPRKPAPEARKERPLLVDAAMIKSEEYAQTVVRNGTLRARRILTINTQEEGRIERLPFYEGDQVRRGDLLFTLDAMLLKAQLKRGQAERRQTEIDLARLERLSGSNIVTEEELAQARTAVDVALAEEDILKHRVAYTRGIAPFDGIIASRLAEPGDAVQRFAPLLTLIDPSSLFTEVDVSELLLSQLAIGDEVEVRIDALGNTVHSGRIVRIHPQIDPLTRQGVVEVDLEPPPQGARPGQFCRVTLVGRTLTWRLIPFSALKRDLEGEYVFVIGSDSKVEQRRVISGPHFGERVALTEGLLAGDEQVVSRGFSRLIPGKRVTVVGLDDE